MARARSWVSLSPSYRERLTRNGINRETYESGVSLSAARGHASTPEHGLRSAQKNPQKYAAYIAKRQPKPPPGSAPPIKRKSAAQIARELESARNKAFRRFLSVVSNVPHLYWNVDTIEANVFGGFTSESGAVPGMTIDEARFAIKMTYDDLVFLAAPQYLGNPWWYH